MIDTLTDKVAQAMFAGSVRRHPHVKLGTWAEESELTRQQYRALAGDAIASTGLPEMPTIWEDPADKGYPCFERLMTPAECKAVIDRDGQRIALMIPLLAAGRDALQRELDGLLESCCRLNDDLTPRRDTLDPEFEDEAQRLAEQIRQIEAVL